MFKPWLRAHFEVTITARVPSPSVLARPFIQVSPTLRCLSKLWSKRYVCYVWQTSSIRVYPLQGGGFHRVIAIAIVMAQYWFSFYVSNIFHFFIHNHNKIQVSLRVLKLDTSSSNIPSTNPYMFKRMFQAVIYSTYIQPDSTMIYEEKRSVVW